MRTGPRRHAFGVAVITILSMLLAWGCSTADDRIGVEAASPSPPAFEIDEAGVDVQPGLVSYCPSNKCPSGYTTCPDSFFPCDVDLTSDVRNCGACGVVCPETGREVYSCVGGQCVMTCKDLHFDCDGIADNGCEIPSTNDNCGGCGIKCLDPAKPCFSDTCGCPAGKSFCISVSENGAQIGACYDTRTDDTHCGECGNACDKTGGGRTAPPHMYFGCLSSACGELKCEPGWQNCDGRPENGCETESPTDTNCTACGDDCLAKGQTCLRKPFPDSSPYCGCEEGHTFCGACKSDGTIIVRPEDGGALEFPLPVVCRGICVDLTNNIDHCGACGQKCSGTCQYGTCIPQCPYGRADCDGNPDCEANILNDPHNCGGCGIVCNAAFGQACSGGRCVVEPCETDDGGLAR